MNPLSKAVIGSLLGRGSRGVILFSFRRAEIVV